MKLEKAILDHHFLVENHLIPSITQDNLGFSRAREKHRLVRYKLGLPSLHGLLEEWLLRARFKARRE